MSDLRFMRLALRLARRACGAASPNPLVGAVLVKGGRIIGRGWHRCAGRPHAEIEALLDAQKRGHRAQSATLYVTLEPCCTRGRTPPCTDALIAAKIKRVVIGAVDPNPKHAGRALNILKHAGIETDLLNRQVGRFKEGKQPPVAKLAAQCVRLNEAFNHWIVHRCPWITVKSAMTLDGKIATAAGRSKWITSQRARAHGMRLRQGADAILVGINTILADDPALTARRSLGNETWKVTKCPRRIVLDSMARTPLAAKVVCDAFAQLTTIVVSRNAPRYRTAALAKRVKVVVAPLAKSRSPWAAHRLLDLRWLLKKLGAENVTHLLVEGGGEVNASFLLGGLAHRVAFFYAPKILGGRDAHKAVAGAGARNLAEAPRLRDLEWKSLGPDGFLTATVALPL